MSGSLSQQIATLNTRVNTLTSRVDALVTRLNAMDVKDADYAHRIAHLELIVWGDPGTGVAVVPP